MSRPKVTDYDRVKGYVARCDLVGLRQLRELVDFAMMREGIEPMPARKPRKAKTEQPVLPGVKTDA